MSFDPSMISNNILKRAFDEGIPVTPMKLQKILYFAASEYAKRSGGQVLLAEPFSPWKYGPVLQSVYSEFKTYGAQPIKRYAKDSRGRAYVIDEEKDETLSETLSDVWEVTKGKSAFRLSEITHNRGSAWWDAYQDDARYIDDIKLGNDTTYASKLGLTQDYN